MLLGLLVRMVSVLALCRVLLIAGVQTLTIDSQLGTSIEDCFERISIGEHLPSDAIYRNVSELTNRECEQICKQDKQCQAYDYGVGAKGNATCNLSTLDEKTINEQNPLKRHPDYDVYIRRFQCEQSPPTPIQTPLSDDAGPQHRPVFRPVEERPTGEDYLISGDIGYGKPDDYRPDDISSQKPIVDIGPSYGEHKPQDIPFRPGRPQEPYRPDLFRPQKPNDPYGQEGLDSYRPGRPNDKYRPERPPYGSDIRPQDPPPYGPERPQELYGLNRPQNPPYGSNRPVNGPNRPPRPDSNDVLQFQDPKPPLSDEYNRPDPYRPEKPEYHYIVRPNRKPRPQNDYPQNDYAQSGPIGPPDRPYRPTRPYDKPSYTYNSQYASNYGQNSQSDNSIYVEINDPPRPYVPIKDRPNQQYNGLGYLGYGTYSSQNSYLQSQNQYGSSITETGYQKPGYVEPPYNDRPQKPGYGSQRPDDYEKPYGSQSSYGSSSSNGDNQYGYDSNQSGYGSNQGGFGSTQASYNTQKGSYTNNKGSYNGQSDLSSSQYGSIRPLDNSNYGETGYGLNQRPNDYKRPSITNQGSYGNQNSYKGSHSSSYNEQNSHQSSYNSQESYETHRPYELQSPYKPQKPYEKPFDSNQGGYGGNQNTYGNNQDGNGSSQSSYNNKGSQSSTQSYGSSSYGSQGNYGSSYSNQGSDGYGQSGHRPGQNYGGDGSQGYGSNQSGYGNDQGGYDSGYGSQSHGSQGYGFSSSHTSQSYGESQFAEQSSYGAYGNRPLYDQKPGYGNSRPDYNNRPDYDYERPGYGQRPSYAQKPQDQTGYGQKPNYESQNSGYGGSLAYNDPKPGYNDPKPGYNDPKPGYNDPKPQKPYNDAQNDEKPDPPYQDIKPVYEYDIDKPNNVPAYIAKPGGEVVTSQPVVIGDYGRPGYREPGVPRKDVGYRACFRRVLAGQRALRSFVRRVVACERLEDCRRECAEERRFHCESFNYRLDPSFRGKGLCELMTKPIESFDIQRDFVQDKDYDFYEIDRNSLEPNCPETLRGPGLLHSGFLASKDRIDDRNRPERPGSLDGRPGGFGSRPGSFDSRPGGFLSRPAGFDSRPAGFDSRPGSLDSRPNRIDGWRDRNDWVDRDRGWSQGYKGNRRDEDRYVPYQIGIAKPGNEQEKWGQYGGVYGGSQYYKNRNDFHKSIHHWGLTSERPTYGVKPYDDHRNEHRSHDRNDFDYYSLGKNLRKYFESTKDDRFAHKDGGHFDYHDRNDRFGHHDKNSHHFSHDFGHDFDSFDHTLGREDKDVSTEDYYGVGKGHRYGYGSWKKGRWNVSGLSNGLDEDDLSKTYYEASDRSDEGTKDCFSRRRPGMSLSTGAIRRSLIVRSVLACEAACFEEKEFKCVSYSYRYTNARGSDNCYLSERPFHGLDLSADSGSDVYAMPQDQTCSTVSHTPWIESECFYHVRSDTAVSGSAVASALTVAGLGACEAECIRARGVFCRGFSFRFDSPTIGEELHNCILTSLPPTSLSSGSARRAAGHELYARGNYGKGCEPHVADHQDNGECYLQYDKAAKLTPSSTRGRARVKDERSCSDACTDAPFTCLSFSYNNNAPPETDNCLLSEIRLFDLKRDVDYVHSTDDWLFAFDLFNSKCWRKIHSDEPSSEVPHPIHTSSEEDFPTGPTGSGYLPDTSGPSGPPSEDAHYISSGPPSGPSYHPQEEYKPSKGPNKPHLVIHTEHKPYPSESDLKPGYGPPDYKPGYKEESYRPVRPGQTYRPDAKPEESYRPVRPGESYRPDAKPEESYRPISRPEETYRPGYPDPEPNRPSYRPENNRPYPERPNRPESLRPGYPDPEPIRPSYRPDVPLRPPERESYRPFRPESRPDPRPEYRPDSNLPGPYKPGFRPSESYPGRPDSGIRPGNRPGYGDRPGYLPGKPGQRPERPGFQGDREGSPLEVPWRHYTVSGFPCRAGTACAQNVIVGHWACEPEGGEVGSWDYCCAPSHRCGYSEGFHKPWCYVGPKEDQWRPCSEKYYPYHQHNVPHPSSQGHREDRPNRPLQRPGAYPAADRNYWDNLYENGPNAYYDNRGNPLPGYTRVPTEDRPHIRNRYNPSRPPSGNWVPVSHEDPTGVPGALGAPRYWPVAYLHKDPPPNTTYFRYNETKPTTTTTEKNDRTTTLNPISRELPESRINNKPDDLDAKSTRDDKKINVSHTDDVYNIDVENDTVNVSTTTTTELMPTEKQQNISEVEAMKTENYKELDRIDGIDDKLHDFTKSIEVFDIEDVKDDKPADLKMLEAEERQIEAIGRLLAERRGTKLVLEKRSQKDLENRNLAIDKDLVDFNFGNRFPTQERRPERRGVIKRISKDEIERDRNIDRSLEVSETTFVRPPRVLSTTENIRKAIVNGKVFYDATLKDPKEIFKNNTQNLKISKREETTPAYVSLNNNFREQRDTYLNSTRKPKHLRRLNETYTTNNTQNLKNYATKLQNSTRKAKTLQILDQNRSPQILREERDIRQNNTNANSQKFKRRNDENIFTTANIREIKKENSYANSNRNSSRIAKNLRRLEESNTPSLISNSTFGKRKTLIPRNVNPVRRVRRVYRKRYNPEEVRKRLLERERNKNNTDSSKRI